MRIYVIVTLLILAGWPLNAAKKDPAYREARHNGALTKIVLHVADDDGKPVVDASVRVFLGMNFRPKGRWIGGTTDTNGVFVVDGKTCGDEIEVCVAKVGYYNTKAKYWYAKMGAEHEVKDGKWQPYGADEKIRLRKILSPIRMVSHVDGRFAFSIAATNVVFGFDMVSNDWVAPYGKGKIADFNAEFQSDGLPPNASKFSRITLSFPDPLGGAYEEGLQSQSDFKGPYFANTNRFANVPVVLENTWSESGRQRGALGENRMLVVRSRCKVDERGRLLSAHYSSLDRLSFSTAFNKPGSCRMLYHFNPTPNDANLEPKR